MYFSSEGIVAYRIAVLSAFYAHNLAGIDSYIYKFSNILVASTAACIHLVFIGTLSFIYRRLAVVLTDWELWPTRSEYNNALTVKLFMLQFTNYYSAVFYIAYFKGRCASLHYMYWLHCTIPLHTPLYCTVLLLVSLHFSCYSNSSQALAKLRHKQ